MTAACALHRNSTAAGQVRHVQYSFCAAPEERSGSEHDLTGWLDDIPTSPGVRLPPRQRHKTQPQLSSIQCNHQEEKILGGEYSLGCETALCTQWAFI